MSDNSFVIAVIFVLVFAGWWWSSLARMRRDVENKSTVFKRDKFSPYKPDRGAGFAYDAYYSLVAFIRYHFSSDNHADDNGVD